MPHAVNGTGTMWYGRALPESDGSYVVTEWVTFFYAPLIPIGSRRILWDTNANREIQSKPWYKKSKEEWNTLYYRTIKAPIYWPQVFKGYLWLPVLYDLGTLIDYFDL